MRSVFSKALDDHRVTVFEGTFEDTGLPDGWGDLVIIAQAFHWCNDYERACAELSRILKPFSPVFFIWNLEDRERARWVAQVRNRIELHEAGTPQFRLGLWRKAFDTSSFCLSFHLPVEKIWQFNLPATDDIVVDRATSKSYISVLPDDERAAVREDVRMIVEKGEEKVWIDEDEGVFEYPYKCFVVHSQKYPVS